jgi:hypothetical protein
MRYFILWFSTIFCLPSVAVASGSELGEALGANTLATGWTGVANPYDNAAITVNPALLGLEERYDFMAGLSYGPHPYLGWTGTMADSKTSEWVALGISYQRQRANPELTASDLPGWVPEAYLPSNERLAHDVTLAVATAFLQRRVSVGVNGTLISYEHDRHGAGFTGNMDVGIGLRPVSLLTVGLVGRNLLPISRQSGRLAAVAGGFSLADPEVGGFSLELERKLEEVNNHKPWRLGAGVESAVGTTRIRSGYRWDATSSAHWITAGLGAQNELGGVEYGIAIPLRRDFGEIVHQISMHWSIPTELRGTSY